jgi:hypothetical protein
VPKATTPLYVNLERRIHKWVAIMIRIAAISRKKYESGEICRFFAILHLLADHINLYHSFNDANI